MLSRGSRGPRLSPRSACLTGLKEEVSTKGTPQRTGFHQALKDDLVRSLPCGGWGGIRTHGTLPRTLVFKTSSLNRSDTHPFCLPMEKAGTAPDTDSPVGRQAVKLRPFQKDGARHYSPSSLSVANFAFMVAFPRVSRLIVTSCALSLARRRLLSDFRRLSLIF